tara:strand:- start:1315 stop:1428 length:114 start_codon:yes stop_codon:yes gene_type:complete
VPAAFDAGDEKGGKFPCGFSQSDARNLVVFGRVELNV